MVTCRSVLVSHLRVSDKVFRQWTDELLGITTITRFFPMISVDVHPGGHGFDHCLNDHVYMASGGTSEIAI